jgi:hypothetical protein
MTEIQILADTASSTRVVFKVSPRVNLFFRGLAERPRPPGWGSPRPAWLFANRRRECLCERPPQLEPLADRGSAEARAARGCRKAGAPAALVVGRGFERSRQRPPAAQALADRARPQPMLASQGADAPASGPPLRAELRAFSQHFFGSEPPSGRALKRPLQSPAYPYRGASWPRLRPLAGAWLCRVPRKKVRASWCSSASWPLLRPGCGSAEGTRGPRFGRSSALFLSIFLVLSLHRGGR